MYHPHTMREQGGTIGVILLEEITIRKHGKHKGVQMVCNKFCVSHTSLYRGRIYRFMPFHSHTNCIPKIRLIRPCHASLPQPNGKGFRAQRSHSNWCHCWLRISKHHEMPSTMIGSTVLNWDRSWGNVLLHNVH